MKVKDVMYVHERKYAQDRLLLHGSIDRAAWCLQMVQDRKVHRWREAGEAEDTSGAHRYSAMKVHAYTRACSPPTYKRASFPPPRGGPPLPATPEGPPGPAALAIAGTPTEHAHTHSTRTCAWATTHADSARTSASSLDKCSCFRLRERRADSLLDSILYSRRHGGAVSGLDQGVQTSTCRAHPPSWLVQQGSLHTAHGAAYLAATRPPVRMHAAAPGLTLCSPEHVHMRACLQTKPRHPARTPTSWLSCC